MRKWTVGANKLCTTVLSDQVAVLCMMLSCGFCLFLLNVKLYAESAHPLAFVLLSTVKSERETAL